MIGNLKKKEDNNIQYQQILFNLKIDQKPKLDQNIMPPNNAVMVWFNYITYNINCNLSFFKWDIPFENLQLLSLLYGSHVIIAFSHLTNECSDLNEDPKYSFQQTGSEFIGHGFAFVK